MENKYKIIALFGPAGAGKDTIAKIITREHPNFNWIVSATTRPPRDNEEYGKDYYFLTKKGFKTTAFLEKTKFNNWYYGTPLFSLKKDRFNIGVFNIKGIQTLRKNKLVEVFPIKIDAKPKIRLERQLKREKNPNCLEICRRFLADEEDFKKIDFAYETVYNNFYYSHTEKRLMHILINKYGLDIFL